ncbi:MAG: hypothetical protein ACRD5F_15945 [Candidatus Acidiferrales bacterium]
MPKRKQEAKPAEADHTKHHIHPVIQQQILKAAALRLQMRKASVALDRAEAQTNHDLELVVSGYDPFSEDNEGGHIPLGQDDTYECPCEICTGKKGGK